MWLPEPVYKSLPTLYAAMGACFILGVFYVGLDAPMSPMYLGFGLVSILASITVSIWRGKGKGNGERTNPDESSPA